jgi:tetratricopeptide (TPR) repeat protein
VSLLMKIKPLWVGCMAAFVAGCSTLPNTPRETDPYADFRAQGVQVRERAQTPDPNADLMYQVMVGELAGQRGQLDLAVKSYWEASVRSNDPELAARAVRVALYARDNDSALKAAERWVLLAPKDLEARKTLASLYVDRGDMDAALPHLNELIKLADSGVGEGYTLVGRLLGQSKAREQGVAVLQKITAQNAQDPYAHFTLARLAYELDQQSIAEPAILQAIKLKPKWRDARILHTRVAVKLGKPDTALPSLSVLVAEDPKDWKLRMTYVRFLVEVKRTKEALRELRTLNAQFAKDAEVLFAVGLLALEMEQYDFAQTQFDRVVATGERVDDAQYFIGRIAEERKATAQAMAAYNKVSGGQYYVEANSRIAALMAQQGQLPHARAHLQSLREARPDMATELYALEGELLAKAKLHLAAFDVYTEALGAYPGHPDLLYARALVAEQLDKLDVLEQDLRSVIDSDPDNAHALNALGYTLVDRTERYQEAKTFIERAYELQPNEFAIIDSMGWLAYRLGDHAKALEFLRKAYDASRDPEVAAHLGEVLWVTGDKAKARAIFAEAVKAHPDNETLLEVIKRLNP